MKNISTFSVYPLSEDALRVTNGGSEFSESIFRGIGWVTGGIAGGVVSACNYYLDYQREVAKLGLVPIM